jgi:hypothetical protein
MNQNSHTLSSATDDEGAIRSLYQQLMDGWNAASGDLIYFSKALDLLEK